MNCFEHFIAMSLREVKCYHNLPFSTEMLYADFYIYHSTKDVIAKCKLYKEEIIKCRTVGILQSLYGKFYLYDIDDTRKNGMAIQISMVYLKSPPQSIIMPYPVQIFGMMQWKNRPVIFVKILQVLSVPMAVRMKETMSSVVDSHLATNLEDQP